jgi:cysteine-rich repeat protein
MKNAKCGNGMREAGEQCDDGNTVSGDGCSAFCQNEETIVASVSTCGNGLIEAGEQCDDANEDDNDTCSSSCTITEGVTRKAATTGLQIDADVIIVNPTEIANAIKFITGNDPCSTLVMKGQNQKASLIREAGRLQNIPIIENIPLAREIFSSIRPGETIYGDLCKEINIVKAKVSEKKALPSIEPTPQPLPQAPTQYAYGYYPYAQVTPLVVQQPPAGDTGPAMVGIAISGIAGGMGWVRRRRKKAL